MTKIAPLAAALLLGLASPAAAAAEPQTPTRAVANLSTYVTDADYPAEAIRNRQQGIVTFRLQVGSDGRVTGCSILSSSGSSALDAATCRIMRARPRFEPARDAGGRPVPDEITSRIAWRLPTQAEMPPRLKAAFSLWTSCVMGEASKLAPGDLPAGEVARRSFPPCAGLERLIVAESKSAPLDELRGGLTRSMENALDSVRAALKSTAATGAPEASTPPR